MSINEKGTHRIAFFVTLFIHVFVLIIPLAKSIQESRPRHYKIPIQLEVTTPPPVKKAPVSRPAKPEPAKKGKAVAQKKQVKQKPTFLPGDRKTPVISSSMRPIYPKIALNNNWEGKIQVEFIINKKGHVESYKIIKSTGHQELDDSFIRTVKQFYKFKPKRHLGENKTGKVKIKYTFSLGD